MWHINLILTTLSAHVSKSMKVTFYKFLCEVSNVSNWNVNNTAKLYFEFWILSEINFFLICKSQNRVNNNYLIGLKNVRTELCRKRPQIIINLQIARATNLWRCRGIHKNEICRFESGNLRDYIHKLTNQLFRIPRQKRFICMKHVLPTPIKFN